MNDEEKKAWEEFVESANVDLRYRATCTRLGQSIPERVAFSLDVNTVECILAADAALTRLRATVARVEDVEGMEAFLNDDYSMTVQEVVLKLRDYLLKGEGKL